MEIVGPSCSSRRCEAPTIGSPDHTYLPGSLAPSWVDLGERPRPDFPACAGVPKGTKELIWVHGQWSGDMMIDGVRECPFVAGSADRRDLRRRFAMSWAHAGCGRPGWVRSARARTWCTCISARCSQSSQRPARTRELSSLPLRRVAPGTARRSIRIAIYCRRSGMPPNRATSGCLPILSKVTWKHRRRPCGVTMVV